MLSLTILLSGCVTARSNVLPDLVTYSEDFQMQAGGEVDSLPPACHHEVLTDGCSAIHRLVIDYLRMRDQVRAVK